MVDTTGGIQADDNYEQLNKIARGRPSGEFYDENEVSPETFETVCSEIIDDMDDLFDDFSEETIFTRRQAQIRVLKDKTLLPTDLTNNAIGVLVGWIEGKDSPLDESSVRQIAEGAAEKASQSVQTAYMETAPDVLRDKLSSERPVWLDHTTYSELKSRRQGDEQFADEVIDRLLTETREVGSLRELLETIIANEEVADIKVSKNLLFNVEQFEASHENPKQLLLDVSAPWQVSDEENPLSQYLENGTVYEHADFYFDVEFVPSHAPGGMLNSLDLYAKENIGGMEPVPLEEGLERLEEKCTEERADEGA